MRFRSKNPAMWRGESKFDQIKTKDGGNVLVVTKQDPESSNKVAVIFSDVDAEVPVDGVSRPVSVKAWMPVFVQLK